ncbi:MAG: alpha/beta fold hydrolase [Candidatus Sericytochromatia bacterium]|nr:alpha/beta fold hydrolase [Candidatus Sericytochromatia bacterium]
MSGNVQALSQDRSDLASLAERDVQRVFHSYDRNGDGYLTQAEVDLPGASFTPLDTDQDKRLSLAEMTPRSLIDGYLPEMQTFVQQAFQQIDVDHSGRLTPDELASQTVLGALETDFHMSRQVRADGWDQGAFTRQLTKTLAAAPAMAQPRATRTGKTPVLVVQGYMEPSYFFMYGVYRHLQEEGQAVYGINLFPNVSHAETQAQKLAAKIQEILKETGATKINLVCHSFGGLVARHLIQNMGGARYVDRYVSIATPHFGTAWCYTPGLGGACQDMRIGSPFLTELNKKTIWSPVRYSAMYTKTDEITIPARNCELPGAKNYPPVPKTGHFLILWSPTTYQYVDESLK